MQVDSSILNICAMPIASFSFPSFRVFILKHITLPKWLITDFSLTTKFYILFKLCMFSLQMKMDKGNMYGRQHWLSHQLVTRFGSVTSKLGRCFCHLVLGHPLVGKPEVLFYMVYLSML